MNERDVLFSWREVVGRAAVVTTEAMPPVLASVWVVMRFPQEAIWAFQDNWILGCSATALGMGLVFLGVRNLDQIRSRGKDLAINALSATSLAGITTLALLKTVEMSMAGSWGGVAAEGAAAIGVGAMAAYALGKRVDYRRKENEMAGEARRIGLGRQDQDMKIKGIVFRDRDKVADGIAGDVYGVIAAQGGAVSDSMERGVRRLACQMSWSEIGSAESQARIKEIVEAARLYADEIRSTLVSVEDGSIDNQVAGRFVRPKVAARES